MDSSDANASNGMQTTGVAKPITKSRRNKQAEPKLWEHPNETVKSIYLKARNEATKKLPEHAAKYLLKHKKTMSENQQKAVVSEQMYLKARQPMIRKVVELDAIINRQTKNGGDEDEKRIERTKSDVVRNEDPAQQEFNRLAEKQVSQLCATLQHKLIEAITNNTPGVRMQKRVSEAQTSFLSQLYLWFTSMENETPITNVVDPSPLHNDGTDNTGEEGRPEPMEIAQQAPTVTKEPVAASINSSLPPGSLQGATNSTDMSTRQETQPSALYGYHQVSSIVPPLQEEEQSNREDADKRSSRNPVYADEESYGISKGQGTSSSADEDLSTSMSAGQEPCSMNGASSFEMDEEKRKKQVQQQLDDFITGKSNYLPPIAPFGIGTGVYPSHRIDY